MEKETYRILIDAPKEKVWNTLWDPGSYPQWTAAFSPESRVETDNWKKGTDIRFLDGSGNGMLARVADNRPNEFMSFEHYGEIKDGVVDTTSERVRSWAGAHEEYTLTSVNGKTELVIQMDVSEEWKGFFAATWPKALASVKELSEMD